MLSNPAPSPNISPRYNDLGAPEDFTLTFGHWAFLTCRMTNVQTVEWLRVGTFYNQPTTKSIYFQKTNPFEPNLIHLLCPACYTVYLKDRRYSGINSNRRCRVGGAQATCQIEDIYSRRGSSWDQIWRFLVKTSWRSLEATFHWYLQQILLVCL